MLTRARKAQSEKHVPHKHEDLKLDPSTHIKAWVRWYMPIILVREGGGGALGFAVSQSS